jgi:hypothetical protein
VWPFEKRRDVLRIGKLAVELWAREAVGLVKQRGVALGEGVELRVAVAEALAGGQPSGVPLDVVVESAWLPVVLLEAGPNLLRREQVEGLLGHRLARVHDDRTDAVSGWTLQIDHRAGDAYGLGFGLSPAVKAAIEAGAQAAGRRVASVQPALQWARQTTRPREGWWVWLEQDRAVLAWLERGRVVALHPAADLPRDVAAVARLVRIESVRSGVSAAQAPVVLSGWEQPFAIGTGSALSWRGVGAGGAAGATPAVRPAGAAA